MRDCGGTSALHALRSTALSRGAQGPQPSHQLLQMVSKNQKTRTWIQGPHGLWRGVPQSLTAPRPNMAAGCGTGTVLVPQHRHLSLSNPHQPPGHTPTSHQQALDASSPAQCKAREQTCPHCWGQTKRPKVRMGPGRGRST